MPVIYSVPATYNGSVAVTFAIPIGNWTSGTWSLSGNTLTAPLGVPIHVVCNAHSATFTNPAGNPWTTTAAVTANQLADINALGIAGGTLNAQEDAVDSGIGPHITAFSLTLVGAGSVPPSLAGNDPPVDLYIPGVGLERG